MCACTVFVAYGTTVCLSTIKRTPGLNELNTVVTARFFMTFFFSIYFLFFFIFLLVYLFAFFFAYGFPSGQANW